MRVVYRIAPPNDQYHFVEVEQVVRDSQSPSDIRGNYEAFKSAFNDGDGLSDKEMDEFVQNWLEGKNNHINLLEKMNGEQKKFYQTLKRARNRAEYKASKQEQKPIIN